MSRPRGGLAPANIRLPDQLAPQAANTDDISVEIATDGPDVPHYDTKGAVVRIEHEDGSITVSLDGRPISEAQDDAKPAAWFDNLVDKIDDGELARIADDLLRGIDDDIRSRQDWIDAQTKGVKLLGLKIETPTAQGSADAAPVEGMSTVRHPLMLEACLRFNANARSELLPTDGPVKVRIDAPGGESADQDDLADALELDINHFLTAVATEYYPDTDRMLFKTGFCGVGFKKVFFCPLRNRPVSESVEASDLIVNNAATDLGNAKRVTHRIMMRPSTVRRLQILGVYRDITLSEPQAPKTDSLKQEEAAQQGISETATNPQDRDREIYECYSELDIKGFEHRLRGKETGLEIPYRVTIDVSSREILSIVRNYDEDSGELPEAREAFVAYIYVPGFGFYPIGLLHILGNPTNALTAAWREMLDSGMFANFPGFLVAKAATRQQTNVVRVAPGSGQQIDTNGMPIQDAVMPLPYKTEGMAALMALVGVIETNGQRLGGTSETNVGEGRQDAPVGTTLALIEQATKVENAVHKRLHAAQAKEFQLLAQCFREHPESFWQRPGKSGYPWDTQTFLRALNDYQLTPQADPNTASHTQRLMKAMALAQAAQQAPQLFKPTDVARTVLRTMGWADPDQFLNAEPAPDPKMIEAQSKSKTDAATAQAAVTTANARQTEAQAKAHGIAAGAQPQPPPADPLAAAKVQAQMAETQIKGQGLALQQQRAQVEDRNRDQDREEHRQDSVIDLAKALIAHPTEPDQVNGELRPIEQQAGIEPGQEGQ